MKSILSSLIFAMCSASAFAAMGLELVEEQPGHPNQCFAKENNAFYNVNENWKLKECGVGSCTSMKIRGRQQLLISYTGCGAVHAEPPCYIQQNKDLEYPDCCPDIVCPEFEETEQTGNSLNGQDQDEDPNNNFISSEYEENLNREIDDDLFGYKNPSSFRFY